jgi:hypothetical protein
LPKSLGGSGISGSTLKTSLNGNVHFTWQCSHHKK